MDWVIAALLLWIALNTHAMHLTLKRIDGSANALWKAALKSIYGIE